MSLGTTLLFALRAIARVLPTCRRFNGSRLWAPTRTPRDHHNAIYLDGVRVSLVSHTNIYARSEIVILLSLNLIGTRRAARIRAAGRQMSGRLPKV